MTSPRRLRGFTLIELLVVIVIIGILVAIALPNFIKVKDKAKEAQAKSSARTILIALERYAVDHLGYPLFLGGGSPGYNPVRMIPANPLTARLGPLQFAFADHVLNASGDFGGDGRVDPGLCVALAAPTGDTYGLPMCMDPLLLAGYLTAYPKNPFRVAGKQSCFGQTATCGSGFSWGGSEGDLMFDTSAPRGDWPFVSIWPTSYNATEISPYYTNQLPGNFYYHPLFADGMSTRDHRVAFGAPGSGAAQQILSHFVAGYTLSVLSGTTSPGQDVTHMTPCWFKDANNLEHDCLFAIPPAGHHPAGGYMWQPTGYFSFEPDPIPSTDRSRGEPGYDGPIPAGDEFPGGSGPDGIPDSLAVTFGSGLDGPVQVG